MGRAFLAWLLIPWSLVTLAALGAGAMVRGSLEEGRSFWIIKPVLYLAHAQNLAMPRAQALPLTTLALLLAVVAARVVRSRIPKAPATLELTVAISSGGAVANAIESVTVGSVTDFLGIHGAGAIYSAGDIALAFGLAVAPVTAYQVAATHGGLQTGLIAGAAMYLVVTGVSVTSPPNFGVAALATIVVLVSSGTLLARSRRDRSPHDQPTRKKAHPPNDQDHR